MLCDANSSASNRRAADVSRGIAVALLGVCIGAGAGAQERVFREGAVTEQGLVEALSPPAAAGLGATRGFTPANPAPAAAAAPAGRASILVTFVVASAELTPQARSTLDIVAKALQSERLAARSFTVEGHADPRGSVEGNQRLSQARAQSVVDYLVTAHAVPGSRLAAVGMGSSRLLNRQDPTAAENRRVTLVAR
jgi:outer membrane protein OmpA-like peptidoglycan-associated protein